MHRKRLEPDILTVNLQKTTGSTFFLYPNAGYKNTEELPTLNGDAASLFTLEKGDVSMENSYRIRAKEGTSTGTYKLSLSGSTSSTGDKSADGTVYPYADVAFTVKVTDKKPAYKLKQSTRVNLFFSDWESPLEITSEETLKNIVPAADDTSDFTIKANDEDGSYIVKVKDGLSKPDTNCNKKMRLTLQFEDYKDITIDYTVGVEKKAPKAAVITKSITLYPSAGLNTAPVNPILTMPKGYDFNGSFSIRLDTPDDHLGLSLEEGTQCIKADGIENAATIKPKLILSSEPWADDITIPLTVKINMGKPTVKLQRNSLQLNANEAFLNYDMALTEVLWKDGAAFDPVGVSVSAADAKAKSILGSGIVFTYDDTEHREHKVVAKLNNTSVAKGSYKFKVNVKISDTMTVSAPLTVKVVNTAPEQSIKVSYRGSIDVLNRENTFVTVTPSLKAINGTIRDVKLTGNAAHLFDAAPDMDGNKVIIRIHRPDPENMDEINYQEQINLITKYPYKVKLILFLQNAEGETFRYTTPDISLKLKQGRPKVSVSPKNAVSFSGSYGNGITRKITATLKGAPDPIIEKVELINNNEAFTCTYQTKNGSVDTFTLTNTSDAVKGKTYSLQLRVTFRDQADNEKAAVIKYSVKVK